MTKNPFINALMAILYIAIVASFMFYGSQSQLANQPDTIVAPIAMISLLTLSVAVMAYLFFYQPFQLYFNGEKKRALDLFIQTVAVFAVITILVIISLFFFNS
jgi:hypothetical protein